MSAPQRRRRRSASTSSAIACATRSTDTRRVPSSRIANISTLICSICLSHRCVPTSWGQFGPARAERHALAQSCDYNFSEPGGAKPRVKRRRTQVYVARCPAHAALER